MGNRIVRIQNDTLWSISMKEHRMLGGSTSQYSYTIRVDPNDNTEIPASLFLKRNHQSGMPSEIVIFTDGTEVRKSLISQDFVRYVKIILCVEGPYLVVKGVLPQFLDLCWFRGCGFLGREYRGRQGVTIMRCRISTLLEVVHTLFFFRRVLFSYRYIYWWFMRLLDPSIFTYRYSFYLLTGRIHANGGINGSFTSSLVFPTMRYHHKQKSGIRTIPELCRLARRKQLFQLLHIVERQ